MILFNLLPWREERRRERQRAFVASMLLAAVLGLAVVLLLSFWNAAKLSAQAERHQLLKADIAQLDVRIREIAGLRQEIDALKARQKAVENLQANRNLPVYLMDEMTALVPVGVVLKSLRQADNILVSGYAQSNERVSEFMRNLGKQGHWLTQPELVEIKSATLGQGKDQRKVFEFTLSINWARPLRGRT
jgi:type IV pilus assembly protein PilN